MAMGGIWSFCVLYGESTQQLRKAKPMIDLSQEHVISLSEAAGIIPAFRPGKHTHPSVLTRWILAGVKTRDGRSVHLRAARCGGRWITSREAIQEFLDAQTPAIGQSASTSSLQSRQHGAANRAAVQNERNGI